MELQMCMETSLDFPFAGLKFDKPWKLKTRRAMTFFKLYGERFTFTRLCLDHCWAEKLLGLAPFIEHLPRLSILEIGPSYAHPRQRFHWSHSGGGGVLRLPSLRTIRLSSPCAKENEKLFREVLNAAASPSLRIECWEAEPETLRVLTGTGRLRALSVISFHEDSGNQKYSLEMDQLLSIEPPSLTKLDFNSNGCVGLDGLKTMLYSSQNTLRELKLYGMCLSEYWDKYPVLPKLTKLSVHLGSELRSFLYHCSHGQSFPSLKEVHLNGYHNILPSSFSNGLFIVPSVTTISLSGYVNKFGMKQLAHSFPNVTEIQLNYSYYSGKYPPPLTNPSEIWNVGEFKCLEKLLIRNYMPRQPSKDYFNMDSFLTGMPFEMCETLRKHKQLHLINSHVTGPLRRNRSILKLENLKELLVKPVYEWIQLSKDTPIISMVSVKYALELMPNLRTKLVYYPWQLSASEKRDLPALEGALKNVQPYVKLEPIFYY